MSSVVRAFFQSINMTIKPAGGTALASQNSFESVFFFFVLHSRIFIRELTGYCDPTPQAWLSEAVASCCLFPEEFFDG